MFSEPPFHRYLAQAQQLRELASNEQILQNDVLPIVASLPLLDHLQVFAKSIDINTDDISLPQNAFPSLRRLSLYLGSPEDADDLWVIPALQQLTYLRIELRDQHSTLTFDIFMWISLSKLPLETVTLDSAWFGPYDAEIYSYIATALPAVVDLRMPAQSGTLRELVHFAKLPKLQHLLLELDFSVGLDWNSSPTAPVGFALHTLETEDTCLLLGDMLDLAKKLLFLWPNLQRVIYPGSNILPVTKLVRSLVKTLNSSITTVREATKLKKAIIENYGQAESALLDALPTVNYPPLNLKG
ncbi:unnamed protein product [Rhizoctonia solani]|uniref:Uncharacterized protein n=1 Tax=Rhizoctonia solani TaxID=456999 RepID=A0A8H2WQW4_9AGAM|nr:unnamed protein product [Rhizoctonia solani]